MEESSKNEISTLDTLHHTSISAETFVPTYALACFEDWKLACSMQSETSGMSTESWLGYLIKLESQPRFLDRIRQTLPHSLPYLRATNSRGLQSKT